MVILLSILLAYVLSKGSQIPTGAPIVIPATPIPVVPPPPQEIIVRCGGDSTNGDNCPRQSDDRRQCRY